MGEKTLQWHPGFQAALQVELEDEKPYLKFYEEYNLSEMPLQIDVLIIKADPGYRVRKSMQSYTTGTDKTFKNAVQGVC